MMMRMLEAGGMTALTDQIREADVDNPRGYYEYEPVKRTKQDPSWLDHARGKVVKMVYQLLYDLPEGYEYRVVFMQRNLTEVLKSQQKMLERLGTGAEKVPDVAMSKIFQKQLEQCRNWLSERPHFDYLEVDYNRMMADPGAQIASLNQFLGGQLATEEMRAVVEPELYRNRT